jgi:hypothetical protein
MRKCLRKKNDGAPYLGFPVEFVGVDVFLALYQGTTEVVPPLAKNDEG